MNKQQLIALINAKIAGQGSAVDVGGALPAILSGILDMVAEVAEDTPRPIILSDMPTDEGASLSALAAIGLTPAEVEAAARGKRYGVLIGTNYYCLSFQYYNSATAWAIGFYSISYDENFALYGGDGCTIIVEGTNVTVKHSEM